MPKLPNSLTRIGCFNNRLTKLPELPESLIELNCGGNKICELPKLPINLKKLFCADNKLKTMPKLPNSLTELFCNKNELLELDEFCYFNKKIYYLYDNNPIEEYVNKYFHNYDNYFKFKQDCKRKFINKISEWYLECNYNPDYKQCRKKIKQSYDELYTDV